MPILKEVKNTKEMKDTLQDYLQKINEEEPDEEEKKNNKKIKTYIIESNIDAPLKIKHLPMGAGLIKTEASNLTLVRIPHNYGHDLIYVDSSDKRFWLLHTGCESSRIGEFINELVTTNKSQLDFSWFSSNFLEKKCNIGTGEGFGLKYENSFLEGEAESRENYLRSFSMLFWGGKPSEVLVGLKNNENLVSGVTLSRVKQIFRTEAGYVKESISREGKFTLTKGDSFDSHLLAVDKVKTMYASVISTLEEDYRINYSPTETGYHIRGTYSLIELKKPIENMHKFVEKMFACTQPFRIFGIPQFVEENFVKIAAVDLHTYDKFNLEITPDYIRIFLHDRSCANVVTRLMTNLQHYYDSQIKLIGCDNDQLI